MSTTTTVKILQIGVLNIIRSIEDIDIYNGSDIIHIRRPQTYRMLRNLIVFAKVAVQTT